MDDGYLRCDTMLTQHPETQRVHVPPCSDTALPPRQQQAACTLFRRLACGPAVAPFGAPGCGDDDDASSKEVGGGRGRAPVVSLVHCLPRTGR